MKFLNTIKISVDTVAYRTSVNFLPKCFVYFCVFRSASNRSKVLEL
jgi:hypothetical protein